MSKYRHQLPQLSGAAFMTDGGIETTLIFHERLELPHFAAFYLYLLGDKTGYAALQKYFRSYASLASRYGIGFILESPTWRANPDWGTKLGYSKESLAPSQSQIDRPPARNSERIRDVGYADGYQRMYRSAWRRIQSMRKDDFHRGRELSLRTNWRLLQH
jgi:hypothetical protein